MEDKQRTLLTIAIAAVVIAAGIWWFFGLKGPKSGVADLPKPAKRPSLPSQAPTFNGQNQPALN